MLKKGLFIVLLSLLSIIPLVGFEGRPVWGDPSRRVWHYGELVPLGVLLDQGVVPHCHDGSADGTLTCYDSKEELAAATGLDLPGADRSTIERLRSSGAVTVMQPDYYACVYEHAGFTGRSCALSQPWDDFGVIGFDNITSSIFIPVGAGWSRYFEYPRFGGGSAAFDVSVDNLAPFGWDDMISSAKWVSY